MMLAGIDNFFESANKRIGFALTVTLIIHFIALYSMQMSSVMEQEKAKLITNVELLEIEKPKPLQVPLIQEKPKNVWDTIKQAIPFGKGQEGPRPAADDSMKQILQEAARPPKLVDRTEPLSRLEKSQLEELKKQRDEKLNELKDLSSGQQQRMANIMVQEQALTESAKPIVRPSMGIEKGISIEEVGMKRAENISDIIKTSQVQKSSSFKDASATQLVERKAELKKQLAALNAMPSGTKLEDRGGGSRTGAGTGLREVVGNIQERRKAQELLALQKLIEEKEPSKPSGSGGGGGGRGGFGFGTGSGAGLQTAREAIKFSEPKEVPVSRPVQKNVPNVLEKMKKVSEGQTVQEVKKAPVEISGPLEKRKVVSAYVPQYPEWAKRQGLEADISLRFFVNASGSVTPDISVVITSGYRELDQLCIESLRKWVFVPLSSNESQIDQWGIITIRFRLE
ncbi:MAG: TonB family protein [Elusimicrobia bacterium]|nr:TonB family protein [Elusimicrobiota bacterium]